MINRPAVIPVFVALALASPGWSQESAPEDSRAPATAKVRGWLFPSGDKEVFALALKPTGASEPVVLASTKDGAVVSDAGYTELQPSTGVEVALQSGEKTISAQALALREGCHYTIVAWSDGGRWQLKAYADDLGSPNATDRPLRVLNFAEGRPTSVSVAGGAETKVAPDSVTELRAPSELVLVTVKVQAMDGGAPAQSSVELDFSFLPCAYVAIGPDYRGRMRPRIISGGSLGGM